MTRGTCGRRSGTRSIVFRLIVKGVGRVISADGGDWGMIIFRPLTAAGLLRMRGWGRLIYGRGIEFFRWCVVKAGIYVLVVGRDHGSCIGSASGPTRRAIERSWGGFDIG